MTFTRALSTNNYGPAKFIVDGTTVANGTHSTITAAIASAVAGDTIFIRPGTYTENLTLKAGVNLSAFVCDSSLNATGHVIISGTCNMTTAGSVTISGIQLQTNSAALLAVTGSAASIVNLNNCYLNCTNNTGITYSSSDATSAINIYNCNGNIGTTGIGLWTHSSAGTLKCSYSSFTNSGASTTATTNSAGDVQIFWSFFFSPLSTSSTGGISYLRESTISSGNQNTTALTINGTGQTNSTFSTFSAGTASAISVGNGATLQLYRALILSSNTNAITGGGTLYYWDLVFNSSTKINTTTQVGGTVQGGVAQAPSAGFIGEQISSAATSVATTTATPISITSISLTAGIWDISAIATAVATGGTTVMSSHKLGISTTDNTFIGNIGDDQYQFTSVANALAVSSCVPQKRATLTGTTIYYAVVQNNYTSTTCPTNARISATRVG